MKCTPHISFSESCSIQFLLCNIDLPCLVSYFIICEFIVKNLLPFQPKELKDQERARKKNLDLNLDHYTFT